MKEREREKKKEREGINDSGGSCAPKSEIPYFVR